MSRNIAIVEDEPLIRANYVDALNRLGYAARGYASRGQASVGFAAQLPDLVIIDADVDGEPEAALALGRELRTRSASLPLIFLASNDADYDAMFGRPPHADDYLTRNTSLRQLAARLAAIFRRLDSLKASPSRASLHKCGPLALETERMLASWHGTPVPLTITEFWIVHALVRQPGVLNSRARLLEAAALKANDRAITAHVGRIRRKFKAVDSGFRAIQTVRRKGWRWLA